MEENQLFDQLLVEANEFANDLSNPEAKAKFHLNAMVLLAKLKLLNRKLHVTIDEQRKTLDNKKTDIEKLQLSYENLQYKKNYLQREIRQCKDISTPNLNSIEKERNHPIGTLIYHSNLPEIHEKGLKELENEKQERKEIENQFHTLQENHAKQLERLDKKRKFLDDLPKKIALLKTSVNDLGKDFAEISPPEEEEEQQRQQQQVNENEGGDDNNSSSSSSNVPVNMEIEGN